MAKTIAPEGKMAKALQHLEKIVAAPSRRLHFPRLPQINKAWYIGLAAGIIAVASVTVALEVTPSEQNQTRNTIQNRNMTIDGLATIRQYAPGLAGVLEQQQWFKDGINERELVSIYNIEEFVSEPNIAYLSGKFMINGSEKTMAIFYDKGLESIAGEVKNYLNTTFPRMQEYFGVPVNWSFILIRLKIAEKTPTGLNPGAGGVSEGGIANIFTEFVDYSGIIRVIGHEVAHTLFDQEAKGGPVWHNETMAEMGYYVAFGGEGELEKTLANLDQTRQLRSPKPLAEFTGEDHLRGASEHISKGFDLLLQYRRLVGSEPFKKFVQDATVLRQTKTITNEDIRGKMLLHTPEELKSDVSSMYDAAVYGLNK